MTGRYARAALVAATMCLGPTMATAEPAAQHNSTALWFVNWFGLSNATLRVVEPGGRIETIFASSGTPVYELPRTDVRDGTYRYELSAATDDREEILNAMDNGRGSHAPTTVARPFAAHGHFTVARGVIVVPEAITEGEE